MQVVIGHDGPEQPEVIGVEQWKRVKPARVYMYGSKVFNLLPSNTFLIVQIASNFLQSMLYIGSMSMALLIF